MRLTVEKCPRGFIRYARYKYASSSVRFRAPNFSTQPPSVAGTPLDAQKYSFSCFLQMV